MSAPRRLPTRRPRRAALALFGALLASGCKKADPAPGAGQKVEALADEAKSCDFSPESGFPPACAAATAWNRERPLFASDAALDAVLLLLRDSAPYRRALAARKLWGDPRAQRGNVADAMAFALEAEKVPNVAETLATALADIDLAAGGVEERVFSAVRAGSPKVKQIFLEQLPVHNQNGAALDFAIAEAGDPVAAVRSVAIRTLAAWSSDEARVCAIIQKAVDDPDSSVAAAAAHDGLRSCPSILAETFSLVAKGEAGGGVDPRYFLGFETMCASPKATLQQKAQAADLARKALDNQALAMGRESAVGALAACDPRGREALRPYANDPHDSVKRRIVYGIGLP